MRKEIEIKTFMNSVNIYVDGERISYNFSFYDWEINLTPDDEILTDVLEFIFNSNVSNINITVIEKSKNYIHFYVDCDCDCNNITEDEKLIKKSINQIKRLQKELLSMQRSAGYSSDYLERKFKNKYNDIMINNFAQDYLELKYTRY